MGLKIEPENRELFYFLEQIGYRQKGVIRSLDRSNKLNQILGRFFRKAKKSINVENVLPAAA